jgi:hypothetical protein
MPKKEDKTEGSQERDIVEESKRMKQAHPTYKDSGP